MDTDIYDERFDEDARREPKKGEEGTFALEAQQTRALRDGRNEAEREIREGHTAHRHHADYLLHTRRPPKPKRKKEKEGNQSVVPRRRHFKRNGPLSL